MHLKQDVKFQITTIAAIVTKTTPTRLNCRSSDSVIQRKENSKLIHYAKLNQMNGNILNIITTGEMTTGDHFRLILVFKSRVVENVVLILVL